jgi:hypothetical protein
MDDERGGAPWVDGFTVGQVLERTAARHGDREALVFPWLGVRWTWASGR